MNGPIFGPLFVAKMLEKINRQKNVIEAASAVVASINKKYFATQKEIDALKQTLEKLREENNALNKKLKKSNS